MAGLERGVRPIGDWSIMMALSTCSRPLRLECFPATVSALWRWRCTAGANNPETSQDFPEPETTVTAVIKPIGNLALRDWRLLCCAPLIEIHFLLGLVRFSGVVIVLLPAFF